MAPDKKLLSEIVLELSEPRESFVGIPSEYQDVDVDMWEEEAYLVGLAQQVLAGRALMKAIDIDASIDGRLSVECDDPKIQPLLNELRKIRDAQLNLAEILRHCVS